VNRGADASQTRVWSPDSRTHGPRSVQDVQPPPRASPGTDGPKEAAASSYLLVSRLSGIRLPYSERCGYQVFHDGRATPIERRTAYFLISLRPSA
jgi:hypothetical protein